MRIIRATHLGMCFGVRDAITLALQHSEPLTILGDLVHNETVLNRLRSQGIRLARRLEDVVTPKVMITAHGASHSHIHRIAQEGFQVVEATCPLVRMAHDAILRLAREGYHPVIIGKADHVELRGLTGDLATFDVVLEDDDLLSLGRHPKLGVIAQTTQPIDRVRQLVHLMRSRFPRTEVRFVDTVCQPTKQRQAAAIVLALQCDALVVIGGAQSNNTRELATSCSKFCPRVHLVRGATDLQASWFEPADTIGITAGTSTPDDVIDAVEQTLKLIAKTFESATALTAIPSHNNEQLHLASAL
jgi:4-hydroxy-3-methylbut-2-en-1-yl diphosphate reductase